jgi:hypothetical protein
MFNWWSPCIALKQAFMEIQWSTAVQFKICRNCRKLKVYTTVSQLGFMEYDSMKRITGSIKNRESVWWTWRNPHLRIYSDNPSLSTIVVSVFCANKLALTLHYIAIASNRLKSFPFQILQKFNHLIYILRCLVAYNNKIEKIQDRAFANSGDELSVIRRELQYINSIGEFDSPIYQHLLYLVT